jgi:hypothetical protein
MALYGGLTPKRHIAYSNTKTIQLLDLGVLLKEVREKLSKHGCQSTRSYQNKGKKVFAGTQFLKQTQILGIVLIVGCCPNVQPNFVSQYICTILYHPKASKREFQWFGLYNIFEIL